MSRMSEWALILWTKTREISVVPEPDFNEEDKKAKWGNSWYPAKLISKSC